MPRVDPDTLTAHVTDTTGRSPPSTGTTSTRGESRPRREGLHGVRANHRPNRRRGLLRHRDRQAMDDAPAVHEPLEVVRRRVEVIADLLVGDEHAAAGRQGLPDRAAALRPVVPCRGGLPARARDRTDRRRPPPRRRESRSGRRRRRAAAFRWASCTDAGSASKPTTSAWKCLGHRQRGPAGAAPDVGHTRSASTSARCGGPAARESSARPDPTETPAG